MIVTTAGRTSEQYIEQAKLVAYELNIPYIKRNKQSLNKLHEQHENIVVVGKAGIQLYHREGKDPYFFHPNIAMIRVKRMQNGEHDPLVDAADLQEGDSFLDCTLGYASDSIVASYAVGENGRVTGIEASILLAYLTKQGLQNWEHDYPPVQQAMRKINVLTGDHYTYLQQMPSDSVDVVYFDPMFEESIAESNALQTLAHFTDFSPLTEETIAEAKRVARKKVVLKDHFRSTRFQQFGFRQQIRKTSKFHYGVIDK
ncbi:MAG: class I SAM-dependent methyltransferase [Bacillus sp. (in: firmicutes)]